MEPMGRTRRPFPNEKRLRGDDDGWPKTHPGRTPAPPGRKSRQVLTGVSNNKASSDRGVCFSECKNVHGVPASTGTGRHAEIAHPVACEGGERGHAASVNASAASGVVLCGADHEQDRSERIAEAMPHAGGGHASRSRGVIAPAGRLPKGAPGAARTAVSPRSTATRTAW